jgi:NDP-sugar pyrophosphorylase family protein
VTEESGERVLANAIQIMIDDGNLVGSVQADSRMRLDTPQDLLDANMQLLSEQSSRTVLSELPENAQVHEPVYIDPGVSIGTGAEIGPNVYLESGTVLGLNTKVQDSVILARRISTGTVIENELVSGDR